MNTTQSPAPRAAGDEIARYLEGVRAALADLPADERNGLLEDLPEHLAEVAAEALGPLDERLGPPARYAAELRTAAGLDAGPAGGGRSSLVSAARAALLAAGRTDRAVGQVIGYPKASDFLRLLRPAWWLLRGYLVAVTVTHAYLGESFGLLPRVTSMVPIAWLFIAACMVASIWLGRSTPLPAKGWRIGLIVANVLIAVIGLDLVANRDVSSGSATVDYPGQGVTNLYPYGPDGRPLYGVQIRDQNGNPFNIGDPSNCSDSVSPLDLTMPANRYPLCAPTISASAAASMPPGATPPPEGTPSASPGAVASPPPGATASASPEVGATPSASPPR